MKRSIRGRRQTQEAQTTGLLAVSCIAWLDAFVPITSIATSRTDSVTSAAVCCLTVLSVAVAG